MMQMPRNLVSDSVLVEETIEIVRTCGGRAPAADIADLVLRLSNLDAQLASLLVADMIRDDPRLRLCDSIYVELACENSDTRLLEATDFVVVDVETTGAKAPPGRITEIGAYRISNGCVVAEFQTLVNPLVSIPPFIVQLTGISDAMVRDAPTFSEVAANWLHFAGDAVLIAHNSSFDVRFLNLEIGRVFPGRRMVNSHLCTVKLSRRLVPGLLNYRLHTVAAHFQVPIVNRHRAAGDALATAEIFLRLLDRLREHGVRDIATARRFKPPVLVEPQA